MAKLVTNLDLHYIDGKRWSLLAPFVVISDTLGVIEVPAGFVTDFNSIPRSLWSILPPDEWGHAAVVHDKLYRTGCIGTKLVTRAQADAVHREFAKFDGAGWRADAMYWGLRAGGWVAWNAARKADGTTLRDRLFS